MEKEETYSPSPADLSNVQLPEHLNDLVEQIAENVHDVWAMSRIKEGWTFGLERNDKKKTHPCLVPYNKLSESEKEYDRNTAMDTLRFVKSKGYDIKKM